VADARHLHLPDLDPLEATVLERFEALGGSTADEPIDRDRPVSAAH
jgi:hypothetical protein